MKAYQQIIGIVKTLSTQSKFSAASISSLALHNVIHYKVLHPNQHSAIHPSQHN